MPTSAAPARSGCWSSLPGKTSRSPGSPALCWPTRSERGDDGDEQAGTALGAPVHGAHAGRAALVGGGELAGEQVGRPEPPPGDNEPERLPRPEQGGRRTERDIGLEAGSSRARSEAFSQPVVTRSRPNP